MSFLVLNYYLAPDIIKHKWLQFGLDLSYEWYTYNTAELNKNENKQDCDFKITFNMNILGCIKC